LRWTLVPLAFIVALISNILIVLKYPHSPALYVVLLIAQYFFYILIFAGWLLRNRRIRLKLLFLPYYLFVMNYSIIEGILRFISGSYTVLWEKSNRAD
jgi:hypothetical protein